MTITLAAYGKDKASMIINHDNGKSSHHQCPGNKCDPDMTSAMPNFFSFRHAVNEGWVYTKDPRFTDLTTVRAVWVCPNCIKALKDQRNEH